MKAFGIETKCQLAKLLGISSSDLDDLTSNRRCYYSSHKLRKSDGSYRTLRVPVGPLKTLQEKVKENILDSIQPLDCIHGGVQGRSVMTNALPHVGKEMVFTLDIKDFFPSVCPQAVQAIFERLGFGGQAARALVDITTFDQQLPQGAPTSTGVANLAMFRADLRLRNLARIHGFAYTRYVDDLTFSGEKRLLGLRHLIQRIIEDEGFKVKVEKTHTMHAGERQVVTQLVVNSKLNLPKERRQEIRRNALAFRARDSRQRQDAASIRGQISWLSQINPTLGSRVRKRADIT